MLKEKLCRVVEIPSITIISNNIGEKIEEIKTHLGVLIKMFKLNHKPM